MFKFPSLQHHEKYGYMFERYSGSIKYPQVDDHCLFFETYGDGMTQHSPEIPIPYDLATDYFGSLAAFLFENPDRASSVSHIFAKDYGEKDIAFAASVVYKAPTDGKYLKPRYYSAEERKFGTDAKRHDRRYAEIQSWMDGGPESVVRILGKDFFDPLDWFILNHQVRDWFFKHEGWMDFPKIGKDTSPQEAQRQVHAYEVLVLVIRHISGMHCARRAVENLRECAQRERQPAEEVVA